MRRVLLDENLPALLRADLPGFFGLTVGEVGWAGTPNGELLRQAEAAFDVFVTADRRLPHQQNLARLAIGVVVLAAGSTKLEDLRPLAPGLCEAVASVVGSCLSEGVVENGGGSAARLPRKLGRSWKGGHAENTRD